MRIKFSNWLQNEIKIRNISQAELARRSNITPAQISRLLSGDRNPGDDALLGIANALQIQPEIVFEKAGILPPSSEKNLPPLRRKLLKLTEGLPDSDIDMIIAMLEKRHEITKSVSKLKNEK